MRLPLEDTTIRSNAHANMRIEWELLWDIAWNLSVEGGRFIACERFDLQNEPFLPEAERILRLFKAREGRWPADAMEIRERFPGWFEKPGLHVVT